MGTRSRGSVDAERGKLVIPRAWTVRNGPRSGPYMVPRVGWSRAPKARSGRARARTRPPLLAISARESPTMYIFVFYSPANFETGIREFARALRRLEPPHCMRMGAYFMIIFEAEDEADGVRVLGRRSKSSKSGAK